MKFIRFMRWFFTPLFWLIFPYKVVGKKNIPKEGEGPPMIICCNHISNIDPVYLVMCQKRHVFFMAKEEIFKTKFTYWLFAKKIKAFPVSRGKGDTTAIDTAIKVINEGKMLGIFPEGTRSRDGKLGRAKSGAALIASQTGAYILPAAIVAKDQKIKAFKKTTVIFGEPIAPKSLGLDDENKPNLRFASRQLMAEIDLLMKPYITQSLKNESDDRPIV